MKKETIPDPNQGTLISLDSEQGTEVPNPGFVEYDPIKTDPHPGLSTPVVEGWTVLHRAINDIARSRSNNGFMKLPDNSIPVRKFAQTIDATPVETKELVSGTIKESSSPSKLTHYQRAQYRLNDYAKKQVKRVREYNSEHHLVDDETINSLMPIPVRTLEHRFFYSNTPAEAKAQARRRQTIAKFVSKHS